MLQYLKVYDLWFDGVAFRATMLQYLKVPINWDKLYGLWFTSPGKIQKHAKCEGYCLC